MTCVDRFEEGELHLYDLENDFGDNLTFYFLFL